jgi:hypothetical protein
MESYYAMAGGKLIRLSQQQLLDCASNGMWGSYGCDGGFTEFAFAYANVYPLMLERDYPYENKVNE